MKDTQCSECKYFHYKDHEGAGQCHRYPPTPSLTIHPSTQAFMWENLRPWVQAEEYCGEFKRSIESICE